jgi:phage/plasmid primase-like uncharacterized protein
MEQTNSKKHLAEKNVTPGQRIEYAVYASERVLSIFENSYPDNTGPRLAIATIKENLDTADSNITADMIANILATSTEVCKNSAAYPAIKAVKYTVAAAIAESENHQACLVDVAIDAAIEAITRDALARDIDITNTVSLSIAAIRVKHTLIKLKALRLKNNN